METGTEFSIFATQGRKTTAIDKCTLRGLRVINLLLPSSTLIHDIQQEYREVVERRVFTGVVLLLDNGSYSQLADEKART
ncbi:hypothetical protein YC2023_106482 [Brassica napus]